MHLGKIELLAVSGLEELTAAQEALAEFLEFEGPTR